MATAQQAAWQGLVGIDHLRGQDAAGWKLWNQAPAAVRTALMQDSSFLLLLAAMQQSMGDLAAARALLVQAEKQVQAKGKEPSLDLLSQLAELDLEQNEPTNAIPLYRQVLRRDSAKIGAWTGLLRALHQAGQDKQAQVTQKEIPQAVQGQLHQDPAIFHTDAVTYFQTMAGVEQSLGNLPAALGWLQQMDASAQAEHTEVSTDVRLQEGWLQYNLQQNAAVDGTLMRIPKHYASGEPTAAQQAQIAELTANLAVRRATRWTKQGNRSRALQILNAASQSVGNQPVARIRLAAGYLTAGQPATAVAIYQSVDMEHAIVGDLKAAIGAAMESNHQNLAQRWLQQALADHPLNAGLLLLAAQYADSQGNQPLAERYLRASLASRPESEQTQHQAKEMLASIESSYSGWLGGTGYLNHISGSAGTLQMTAIEVPVELSSPLGERARLTTVVRTVHLDSGAFPGVTQTDGEQPLGTLVAGATAPDVPMVGIAAYLELATRSAAISLGSTPAGFPVVNLTADGSFHRARNPWTLGFSRDSIRESQLSYAGLHDPAQTANVWGGVMANMGTVQYARGNAQSGWYATASGGVVTGRHVASNAQMTGDAGAYWQIGSRGSGWQDSGPYSSASNTTNSQTASLKLGINFYGQHDAHDELFFTYGHGGYFSPRYYLQPAIPITLDGTSVAGLQYEFSGSLGPQILNQASAPYFPLNPALQTARGNPIYPAQSIVGLNYSAQGKIAFLRGDHWLFGAFFSVSNADNYSQQIGGFSLRYLFRKQHGLKGHTAGWFPYTGLRPYQVP